MRRAIVAVVALGSVFAALPVQGAASAGPRTTRAITGEHLEGGIVRGTVTHDGSGAPYSHDCEVRVHLIAVRGYAQKERLGPYVFKGCLGAQGRYLIDNVAPGGYAASFTRAGTATTWYPNGITAPPASEAIVVRSGRTTGDINASLQAGGQLRVRVLNAATGRPIRRFCQIGTTVWDAAKDENGVVRHAHRCTDRNGILEVRHIRTGRYKFLIADEPTNGYRGQRITSQWYPRDTFTDADVLHIVSGRTLELTMRVTVRDGTGCEAYEAPLPADADITKGAELHGVACPPDGSCVASGYYADTNNVRHAVIETEGLRTWSVMRAPLPAGATDSRLDHVACVSGGRCAAVGDYTDADLRRQGLLETLVAGRWSGIEAPLPANAAVDPKSGFESVFGGVACQPSGTCIAAGMYLTTDGRQATVLETLSNAAWTATEAPQPANAATTSHAQIWAPGGDPVSCSASDCYVVGSYDDASGSIKGLIETYSSGTWTASEAPLPSDASNSTRSGLSAVSCSYSGVCAAVGDYWPGGRYSVSMIATLSGGTWTSITASSPDPSWQSLYLDDVECSQDNTCLAVGGGPTVETLTPAGWSATALALPPDAESGEFSQVACSADGLCVGGGTYTDQYSECCDEPLIAARTDGSWSNAALAPMPFNSPEYPAHSFTFFNDAACTAHGDCLLVGSYWDNNGNQRPLTEEFQSPG